MFAIAHVRLAEVVHEAQFETADADGVECTEASALRARIHSVGAVHARQKASAAEERGVVGDHRPSARD
eukprot:6210917-Pleurochrysis_carterae.AAC.2